LQKEDAEVDCRHRDIGQIGLGIGLGQAAIDRQRLLIPGEGGIELIVLLEEIGVRKCVLNRQRRLEGLLKVVAGPSNAVPHAEVNGQ
jgi:hypothetical protein